MTGDEFRVKYQLGQPRKITGVRSHRGVHPDGFPIMAHFLPDRSTELYTALFTRIMQLPYSVRRKIRFTMQVDEGTVVVTDPIENFSGLEAWLGLETVPDEDEMTVSDVETVKVKALEVPSAKAPEGSPAAEAGSRGDFTGIFGSRRESVPQTEPDTGPVDATVDSIPTPAAPAQAPDPGDGASASTAPLGLTAMPSGPEPPPSEPAGAEGSGDFTQIFGSPKIEPEPPESVVSEAPAAPPPPVPTAPASIAPAPPVSPSPAAPTPPSAKPAGEFTQIFGRAAEAKPVEDQVSPDTPAPSTPARTPPVAETPQPPPSPTSSAPPPMPGAPPSPPSGRPKPKVVWAKKGPQSGRPGPAPVQPPRPRPPERKVTPPRALSTPPPPQSPAGAQPPVPPETTPGDFTQMFGQTAGADSSAPVPEPPRDPFAVPPAPAPGPGGPRRESVDYMQALGSNQPPPGLPTPPPVPPGASTLPPLQPPGIGSDAPFPSGPSGPGEFTRVVAGVQAPLPMDESAGSGLPNAGSGRRADRRLILGLGIVFVLMVIVVVVFALI